jgi:hypothetical protein
MIEQNGFGFGEKVAAVRVFVLERWQRVQLERETNKLVLFYFNLERTVWSP